MTWTTIQYTLKIICSYKFALGKVWTWNSGTASWHATNWANLACRACWIPTQNMWKRNKNQVGSEYLACLVFMKWTCVSSFGLSVIQVTCPKWVAYIKKCLKLIDNCKCRIATIPLYSDINTFIFKCLSYKN